MKKYFRTFGILLTILAAGAMLYAAAPRTVTYYGDPGSGGSIRLQSTKHATKGKIYFGAGTSNYYDETTGLLMLANQPLGAIQIAAAAGTADAITADYTPDIALDNMTIVAFVASAANTTTTPTFAPDGLTAHTIVKLGGSPLAAGDIPAALAVCLVQYNLANTRWELLNPGITVFANQAAQTINANATDGAAAPTAVAIAAQEIVGRITGGKIKGLSLTDLYTYFGCTGANQLLGVNAEGTALECKSSISISSMTLSGNLTGLTPSVVLTHSSGVHDGSNDQAIMTDSGESFTASQFVGMTVYNVTDASSCTVTANTGTTITCTLAGGTQNDWDTNDVWQVGPGPQQSGSWFYVVAAGTIRHPATAGYVVCYESDAAAVVTVEMASDSMIFQGVLDTAVTALDAGDTIDSSGSTTGDFQCIHNKSATEAQGKGKRGTWADGGAT